MARRGEAPAPRGVPYTRAVQVVLSAAGAGQVAVFAAGVDWVITSRSVSIAGGAASGASAREYLDSVSDAVYLQGTYDGGSDSSARRQLLQPCQIIYVVWADGPAGAVATFRASGLAYPAGTGAAFL